MKFAYAAAVLLAIPVYLPRLLRIFWVDEAGTFWTAHEGIRAATEKSSHWSGQSVLYGALASFFCLEDGPWREPLLRLPSLLAIGVMLYYTARLATRAMAPAAGLCAFVLLLFHPVSFDIFLQARSYGLAAAAVAASYYLLYEWVETRQRRFAAGWAVASLLIFYLHYLYVVALLAQGLYLGLIFFVRKRIEGWRDLAAGAAGIGLLLLPLAQHMRLLVRESYTLPYAETPDSIDLVTALAPTQLMIGVMGAAVALQVVLIVRRQSRRAWDPPAAGFVVLIVGWWLIGTLALFLPRNPEL